MSNPTSNFNWQMPTNSDLVTDLPADFEVFGQAVDTSMADLKGGTTGQILSKATNTDMDFVWIANDQGDITGITATSPLTGGGTSGAVTVGIQSASTTQSGAVQLSDSTSTTSSVLAATPTAVKSAYDLAAAAIPKSTVTGKGSIVAATASSTPANLSVGNNGETLVADSSTSTGLRYQAPKTQNAFYNSGFDIAQRGTNFTGLSAVDYTLDRWAYWSTTGGQSNYASQQSVGNLSVTPNQALRYCGRFGRTSGTTNTGLRIAFQTLETNDSIRFAGQTVTMSFYARAGADYSATSKALQVYLTSGTGTDQIMYAFTGSASVATSTVTLTTGWQRFSITGLVATNVTELANQFIFAPTGTAGAADYFEITGVQLEVGSVATPFNRMNSSIQQELITCQRYLPAMSGATNSILGFAYSTTGSQIFIKLPTTARVAPTGITVNPTLTANYALVNQGFTSGTPTAIAFNAGGTDYASINVTTTAAAPTLVAGQPVQLQTSTSNGYILFTGCEL
jgi:hypothetical protein